MLSNIPKDWKSIFIKELEKEYFQKLHQFLTQEYLEKKIFPPQNEIFKAFEYCKFNDLKVVILGQDPYHGLGQANGLCFSVNDGVPFPPSLKNIFKELKDDLNLTIPITGNLEHWSKQGVLLLNATLTVEESKAGSHQKKGWEIFTDSVIEEISNKKGSIIFLLWGGFAHQKIKLINTERHIILTTGHPSPLSANKGYWFGNKHFSKVNKILLNQNKKTIDWEI
jgi:uracil-DNA glycosylase